MRFSRTSKQGEILHVPSANLNHVTILLDEVNTNFIECFSHDFQAVSFPDFSQDLQALFTQPLKSIRRSPWLKRAAAEESCATAPHGFSNCKCLRVAFDCARPGDKRQLIAADRCVADTNDRLVRPQIERDELIGFADPNCLSDTG